jgi:predicted permease
MSDFRLALRTLSATPVVTAAAILSLALGIGANTAIFSLVNALVLRTLPAAHAERLALITGRDGPVGISYGTFEQIRRYATSFDGALAFDHCCEATTLVVRGESRTVESSLLSGDFFETLGIAAHRGRLLTAADDVVGGGPNGFAAVISYRLWRDAFGGSRQVVGAPVRLARVPVTIVGVTPPDFHGIEIGSTFDVMLPIRAQTLITPAIAFDDNVPWLNVMLRMKPGMTIETSTAALRAAQRQIRDASLETSGTSSSAFVHDRLAQLREPMGLAPAGMGVSHLRERFARPLVSILAVVALVLLIACANIANLLLAKAESRRHELSVRLALGASRWQIARLFLAEGLVLAGAGLSVGLLFADWSARLVLAQLSTSTSTIALNLAPDWRVFAFTTLTIGCALVAFLLAPVVRAGRTPPMKALRETARAQRGAAGRFGGWSSVVVVGQVALSLVLVAAAGLFLRTFENLVRAPMGMDAGRVLMVTLTAPTVPATERNAFYRRLVKSVAALPGVAAAGGSLNPPIAGFLTGDVVISRPGEIPPRDAEAVSQGVDMTPGLLAAYGVPLRQGRDVDDRDTAATSKVVVVNEALVRRYFPGEDLVGHPVALTARTSSGDFPLGLYTVVGVTRDATYRTVRTPMRPTIYTALGQRTDPMLWTHFYIAVRASTGPPLALSRSVAAALKGLNRDLTLAFQPLSGIIGESLGLDRLVAALSGFFAALALLLAGLGLYGITAHAVATRRTEMGIRMALGARPEAIIRLVMRRVVALVAIGAIAGLIISFWAVRFVSSLLYGLAPHDPVTLAAAAGILGSVAMVAAWSPAWRASRLGPADVLREN